MKFLQEQEALNPSLKENEVIAWIEGGSVFYLNFLLNASGQEFPSELWDQFVEKAKEMITPFKSWEENEATLKKACPSYDFSVTRNDYYRLQKALTFALVTEGKSFKRSSQEESIIRQNYDVRGFFLHQNIRELNQIYQRRCMEMLKEALPTEILGHFDLRDKIRRDERLGAPLGLNNGFTIIEDVQDMLKEEGMTELDYLENFRTSFMSNLVLFQDSTRQYATLQKKYGRKYMKDFVWLDSKDIQSASERIWRLIKCDRTTFERETQSQENLRTLSLRLKKTDNNAMKSRPKSPPNEVLLNLFWKIKAKF